MLSSEEKEKKKAYREKYPEKAKTYKEKNKERIRLQQREYELLNKEKIAERKRIYWQLNGKRLTENRRTEEYKERQREYRKKRIDDDPDYRQHGQLKYLYGISIEKYNEMFAEQKGCCSICGKHQSILKKRLGVDHCHKTGIIRGLLCLNCNHALGKFEDDPKIINGALNYLLRQPGGSHAS